jgi:hypothetical protein
VTLIEDGCATVTPEMQKATLTTIKDRYARVMTTRRGPGGDRQGGRGLLSLRPRRGYKNQFPRFSIMRTKISPVT